MTPAGSLFDEIVLDDPGVCANCFERTHDVIDRWYPSRYIDTTREDMFINPRRYRRYDSTDVCYLDGNEQGPRTACSCGVVDGRRFDRPLSMGKMIDYTHNVVARLREAGVEFDEDRLYDEVRAQKSDPTVHRSDESIFRRSVRRSAALTVREYVAQRHVDAQAD